MDTAEITRRYMEKYNELSSRFEEFNINQLVEDLNNAITQSDMDNVNRLYNIVLEWNTKVDNLDGAKIALDTQFHYLHLPSAAMFGIIYDGE